MSTGDSRRVVIADDEEEIRDLLTEYLEAHGWETFRAVNGLEALLHVKQQRPSAVVLDLHMPRLGGIDALKRIRAFDPTIAVVIVSASIDDAVRRQADALGARAVLNKPIDLAGLLTALGRDAARPELARPAADPPAGVAVASPPARQGSILVVDDDPDVRDVLEEFLRMKSYQVHVSTNGADAVRALVAATPSVVLLDIEMPGLSGVDALPTIKALAPTTAVIMVSGTMNVELAKRALAAGAFDYLTKPVDLARLLESIETAFAMSALGV
ncbi:MAG TPA: response regulator [Methylomirabilota bacterium]|jgi:CheY-like chemotaxis protein